MSKNKKIEVKKKDTLNLTISQATRGIKVKAKSPALERFFKNISHDETRNCRDFPGKQFYPGQLALGSSCNGSSDVNLNGEPTPALFLDGGYYNLTWMRLVGLGRGITFEVQSPAGRANIEEYVARVREVVKHIYTNHIRPYKFAITFTSYE